MSETPPEQDPAHNIPDYDDDDAAENAKSKLDPNQGPEPDPDPDPYPERD
jgi:hypothetical protein